MVGSVSFLLREEGANFGVEVFADRSLNFIQIY